MIRYYVTAAVLGAGWFIVLLIPPWIRQWLLGDRQVLAWHVAGLALASLVIAHTFKRWIGSADSFASHLQRGALLPYAGCLVYLTLFNIVIWLRQLFVGGLANLYETFILYPWGLSYALIAGFVVIPYGFLSQILMARSLAAAEPRS